MAQTLWHAFRLLTRQEEPLLSLKMRDRGCGMCRRRAKATCQVGRQKARCVAVCLLMPPVENRKVFRRCCSATLDNKTRDRETPTRAGGLMVIQVLHCPHCHGTDMVRPGTTRQGKQRYRWRTCPDRGRTFLLAYVYAGQSPDVKCQIVDMALNASGIRDTARVLHVSPTTVLKELKKGRVSTK